MKGYSRFVFFLMVLKCALFTSLNGQNLIPNPGFEELLYCNTFSEYRLNPSEWICENHDDAYGSSADFFHSCNINPDLYFNPYAQPYTWPSFQFPNSGEGFCGMFWGANVEMDPMYQGLLDTLKEYTHVPLLDIPDTSLDYCVGMHVGNIFSGAYYEDSVYKYLSVFLDRFTIGLRNQPPVYEVGGLMPSDTVLFLTADDGAVVRDTQNFTLVRTPYRPSGTERYFIIGNMLHDVDTDYELVTNYDMDSLIAYIIEYYNFWGYPPHGTGGGYFYFDDVFFQAIHPPQIGVHLSDIPGKVWLVDTTTHEEKRWYKTGDDFVISTSDSVLVDAQQGVSYTVQTRNCRLTYTDTLVLDFTAVPSVYTPNVHMYPNPTTGLINLSFGKPVNGRFTVSNVMGQRLVTQSVMGESSTIDLSSFSSGIYFVTLMDDNGTDAQSFKVIKQ